MSAPDPEALYVALISDPARLGTLRRLTYRCPDRCLPLDAIGIMGTVLLHQKRFKQSDEVNRRRSSAAGRAKNTYDGENHWHVRHFWLERSALAHPEDPGSRLGIQCDHVGVLPDGSEVTLFAREFQEGWAAGHAIPTPRRLLPVK